MQKITIDNIGIEELKNLIGECVRTEIERHSLQKQDPVQDELISIVEVTNIFKVSKVTIHKWKRKGLIPFYKVNRKLYFKKQELLKCIESNHKNRYKV